MLFKTFIRKQLRLKAHTVTEIEPSDEQMVVQIERLGARKLCCSRCRRPYRRVHSRAVRERSWRDLSLRQAPLVLRYRPHRVRCSRCGVRVEALPWAEPWARVTKALAGGCGRADTASELARGGPPLPTSIGRAWRRSSSEPLPTDWPADAADHCTGLASTRSAAARDIVT